MERDIKVGTVIDDGDTIIGKADDVFEYLRNDMINMLKTDAKECIYSIQDELGVLIDIMEAYTGFIQVKPCQMGGFTITELD